MSGLLARNIQVEADFIERFVRTYRRRFATAIEHLNREPELTDESSPQLQCLRLCVETMDMMLVNQDRMAQAMRGIIGGGPTLKAA
jgi:hypothetical protein